MYLDTRDLSEKRESLKEDILNSFLEEFPDYEDMTEDYEDIRMDEEEVQSWKEAWSDEIEEIEEIDSIESEVDEFSYGGTLISEDNFEDYCQDLVQEYGYLSKDLPSFISDNIDWSGVADDLRVDYTEVIYQGKTYLVRA